jgi:hypothetical protein
MTACKKFKTFIEDEVRQMEVWQLRAVKKISSLVYEGEESETAVRLVLLTAAVPALVANFKALEEGARGNRKWLTQELFQERNRILGGIVEIVGWGPY